MTIRSQELVKANEIMKNALKEIRDLHCPTPIPEEKRWMGNMALRQLGREAGHGDAVPCQGCSTGDPFLDPEWPCETRELAEKGLELGMQ